MPLNGRRVATAEKWKLVERKIRLGAPKKKSATSFGESSGFRVRTKKEILAEEQVWCEEYGIIDEAMGSKE